MDVDSKQKHATAASVNVNVKQGELQLPWVEKYRPSRYEQTTPRATCVVAVL
jgi:hypothetical protein